MDEHNITIHKSHTKAYLIKVIQLLNLPIQYNMLVKRDLLEELDGWILCNMDIIFEDNLLELTNIVDFIEYLATPPEKATDYKTIKDKQLLMVKARQILAYVNNGQDIARSFYSCGNDVTADGVLLAQQGGDIPSCRRAVYKLNSILPPKDKIELKLNSYTLEEMKYKLKEKRHKNPIFSTKTGKFLITFPD